jgi:hypothetical protein
MAIFPLSRISASSLFGNLVPHFDGNRRQRCEHVHQHGAAAL